MNKKILISIFVVAIAIVAGWNVMQSQSDEALSDVALANVEALADETIPTPGVCTSTIWYEPTSTCCGLIKHCNSGGSSCC
jgi:hypothetical protein